VLQERGFGPGGTRTLKADVRVTRQQGDPRGTVVAPRARSAIGASSLTGQVVDGPSIRNEERERGKYDESCGGARVRAGTTIEDAGSFAWTRRSAREDRGERGVPYGSLPRTATGR
jgi:hypothetical protein